MAKLITLRNGKSHDVICTDNRHAVSYDDIVDNAVLVRIATHCGLLGILPLGNLELPRK